MSSFSAGSSARKDYGKQWLILSEDARFKADALRATYVALLRRANDKVEIEPLITVFDAIERDVARTFASGRGFETQTARNRLRRILACYAMHDPETRYTQGACELLGYPARLTSQRNERLLRVLLSLAWLLLTCASAHLIHYAQA